MVAKRLSLDYPAFGKRDSGDVAIENLIRDLLDFRRELVEVIEDHAGTLDFILTGTDTPEGSVAAVVGTLYLRTDGGVNTTLYVKESGTGNTGWAAK